MRRQHVLALYQYDAHGVDSHAIQERFKRPTNLSRHAVEMGSAADDDQDGCCLIGTKYQRHTRELDKITQDMIAIGSANRQLFQALLFLKLLEAAKDRGPVPPFSEL